MGAARGAPRSRRRKRWALALVLVLVGVVVGASLARRRWRGDNRQDPMRFDLLYAAFNEFNSQRFDRAAALLDRRAEEVEPTPLDWMLRARIAESQGRLPEALGHLKQIPDSDPIGARAWLKAGQIELARHRARAAEAAYHRALDLDSNSIQAYRELAYLYALQRREAECDAQFRALAGRIPLDHILAFAWCQNFCGIWDPEGPRPILRGFVAEDPDDRWSRLALAASYELTYDFDEAEATLGPLPDADPDARTLRVQIALDQGHVAVAERLAQGGPPDHARLNVLRGQLALHRNDPSRAATHFRAALRREPEDRDAIQGLGRVLRQLGDSQAKELLQIAARHDQLKRTIQDSVSTIHTDPKLFSKLGDLCAALDRRAEARAWYQLAIKRDPLDSQAHQALARLDRTTGPTTRSGERN